LEPGGIPEDTNLDELGAEPEGIVAPDGIPALQGREVKLGQRGTAANDDRILV